MVRESETEVLKRRLLNEVASFCQRDRRRWKAPIVTMLRELHETGADAVLFGGTLRSLLIPRVFGQKPGRPRDVDIVVSGVSLDLLRERFLESLWRQTRFGGLQLRRHDWRIDLWPLQQTWAFVRDSLPNPSFASLPSTTFFNMEAVAVEVWPQPGRSRRIYSGDDQFFAGILSRTLEINREENPFPELCVLRALVLSSELDVRIGPRLARYILRHGSGITSDTLAEVQLKHYGEWRRDLQTLLQWIELIAQLHARDAGAPIKLPGVQERAQQLAFWPEVEETTLIRVRTISSSPSQVEAGARVH